MYVLTNLKEIQKRFGDSLQLLESAYFVLRAMCEPDWLDVTDEKNALKLHDHLSAMCAYFNAQRRPTLLDMVLADDQDRSSRAKRTQELHAVFRKRQPKARELEFLGRHWEGIRGDFENENVKSLPRPFRQRMVEGQVEIRKVRALWFQPRDDEALAKLPERLPMDFKDGFGFAATTWEHVVLFLGYPSMKPCWPDVARARRKMNKVCRAFEKEGRTNLEPTGAEIQDAIIEIVSQHEPRCKISSESLFAARVANGDLRLSIILRSQNLQRKVSDELKPVSVSSESICDNLQQLVDRGILKRHDINGETYYVTADPHKQETPRWDADTRELSFRGAVIKTYRGHPAPNQTAILDVFEKHGWTKWVPAPFFRRTLNKTLADLNPAIRDSSLHFSGDGKGKGIVWKTTSPSSSAGN